MIWYPRAVLPRLRRSLASSWVEAPAPGPVYSFTINRRGQGAYRDAGPYVLAYVELEEGPRMLTNIVDCDVDDVRVGQPVTVVFHDSGERDRAAPLPPTRRGPPGGQQLRHDTTDGDHMSERSERIIRQVVPVRSTGLLIRTSPKAIAR